MTEEKNEWKETEEDILSADEALSLLEEKRYAALRARIADLPAADIGILFSEIPTEYHRVFYRLLPKEYAAEIFVEMDNEAQESLISSFSDGELQEMLSELFYDDTVDIIEEMPAGVAARILKNSSPEARRAINQLLRYPSDSAGSIMTTEVVALRRDMTVDQAFRIIRQVAIDKETIYTCYVTDEARHLIGVVSAKTLLISPLDAVLGDIMEDRVIFVNTLTDREEAARKLHKYDLLALPVVDTEERLIGIITVDDAIDVISEEQEADFSMMAAITPDETPYSRASVFSIWKSRIPWLLILTLTATFTGMIISGFESALATCVALTAFIPMLMGTGGNAGSQASTTVIRGLSLGEIETGDVLRVLWKELRVSLLCAVSLAIVTFGKVMLIDNLLLQNPEVTLTVAVVVAVTLALTVVCAKLLGCSLPLLAKKVGLDPAVMANPFITTVVDTVSLLLYFLIAGSLLGI
ncbi:MAG: magnesium transporter [Clostridia bacterium]|nr:magnesium transporter [Clostridia bacterium]